MKIGLIGKGFIGEAFYEGMKDHHDILVWDIDPTRRNTESLAEVVQHCNTIFVSVPTPMTSKGTQDLSIIHAVFKEIDAEANALDVIRTVVIRSTVLPGTSEHLFWTYDNIHVVFNPEFLTEANYINDFKNQSRIILGGIHFGIIDEVADIYKVTFPTVHIEKTTWEVAEMVKYTTNTFLATKVIFANEIAEICSQSNIDYDQVISIATMDNRLGTSHWKVPGPDGHVGFGGTCFPKDLNALISFCHAQNTDCSLLTAVWNKNLKLRPERDWEQLKGRAISS